MSGVQGVTYVWCMATYSKLALIYTVDGKENICFLKSNKNSHFVYHKLLHIMDKLGVTRDTIVTHT